MPIRGRLYFRLLCSFLCIALLPVLLYGGYTLLYTKVAARDNISQKLVDRINESNQAFERMLSGYEALSEEFCADSAMVGFIGECRRGVLKAADQQNLYRRLYDMNLGQSGRPVVCVTDPEGKVLAAVGAGSDATDRWARLHSSLFSMVQSDGGYVLFPCRYDTLSGRDVVLSSIRGIYAGGELLGYLFVDLTQEIFQETLQTTGEIAIESEEVPVSYFVYTWYNYAVYNDYLSDYSRGTYLLDLPFRDEFKSEKPVTLTHDQNGIKFLMAGRLTSDHHFVILGAVPINLMVQNNASIMGAIMILSLVSVVLCGIIATRLTRSMTGPIGEMLQTMRKVEHGDLTARTQTSRSDEIGELAGELNSMIGKMDDLFQRDIEKQRRLFLAEFYNLQSQIQPHFLYNVLDSIKWLAKLGAMDQVCEMVTRLGVVLKSCVTTGGEMETIADSLSFVQSYLESLKICYPDKLATVIQADPHLLHTPVLRFLLQPVVENAFIHGIEPKLDLGVITIRIVDQTDRIVMTVEDDGVGIPPDTLRDLLHRGKSDHGNGLYNVHQRIRLHYGEAFGLSVASTQGVGTTVTIVIPNQGERGAPPC